MDTVGMIGLEGVECTTTIGLLDWEKQVKQTLLLDITIRSEWPEVGVDDLEGGVDYSDIHEKVKTLVENESWQLIETVASAVIQLIMAERAVRGVKVRVTKPGILRGVKRVWVEMSDGVLV